MNKKTLKALYFGLIILFISAGIIILVEKNAQTQDKSGASITPTSKDASEIDTSNWQTYVNERWGYSFKYPKNWYLEEPTIAITNVRSWQRKSSEYSDSERDITIIVYPNTSDPREIVRQDEGEQKSEITVGGEKGFEYHEYAYPGSPYIYRVIFIPKNGSLYRMRIYQQNPEMIIFNQILKTFIFTNS